MAIKSVVLFRGRSHKNQINKTVNQHVLIVSTGGTALCSEIKITGKKEKEKKEKS